MIGLMSTRQWIWLAGVIIGLGFIFIGVRLAPTENELLLRYLAMSVGQKVIPMAELAAEMPFPVTIGYMAAFMKIIGFSELLFRLPNLIVAAASITAMAFLTEKKNGKWELVLLLPALSPWFLYISLFELPTAITLALALGLYLAEIKMPDRQAKWIVMIVLTGCVTMASYSGPIFGLVFCVWKLFNSARKKQSAAVGVVLALTVLAGIYKTHWINNPTWFFKIDDISLSTQSELVDQRVRYEYKINNFENHVPLIVKRLVYNKFYFAYRSIVSQFAKVIDPEKWAFPGQSVSTVARSLWGSKGLAWIMFWQFPLALAAIKFLSSREKEAAGLFLTWGILGMTVTDAGNFLGPGAGLIVPLTLGSVAVITRINLRKWWPIGVIVLWGCAAFLFHFVYHEDYWRDNRPKAFAAMAVMEQKYGQNQPTQITTLIGRSFLYYAWKTELHPNDLWPGIKTGLIKNVYFDHFDLKNAKRDKKIYIGFPGEFLGSKQLDNSFDQSQLPGEFRLLESYKTRDSLSFGNGDNIWAVEIR